MWNLSLQNMDERSTKLGHQRMMERVAVFREAFSDDKDDGFVAFQHLITFILLLVSVSLIHLMRANDCQIFHDKIWRDVIHVNSKCAENYWCLTDDQLSLLREIARNSAITHKPPYAAALWWMTAIYWPDFATFTYPFPIWCSQWGAPLELLGSYLVWEN